MPRYSLVQLQLPSNEELRIVVIVMWICVRYKIMWLRCNRLDMNQATKLISLELLKHESWKASTNLSTHEDWPHWETEQQIRKI